MQDLKNNSINLDPLRNIFEIYANLTVITLLNLNHFWITQAELCLKGTFVKASFMFVTIFMGIYENPRRKPKTLPIPSILKKWIAIKNYIIVMIYFCTSLWYLKKVSSFWGTIQKCENVVSLSPPSSFWIGTTTAKTVFLTNRDLCHFCPRNNRET